LTPYQLLGKEYLFHGQEYKPFKKACQAFFLFVKQLFLGRKNKAPIDT
jgi:hypothetical protein